jgi:fibronectin-binding autotransporter adhesin
MKTHFMKFKAIFALTVSVLLSIFSQSFAANLYWDSNSTTAGAGGTPTGTWGTSNFWNTDLTGANLGAFQIATLNTDDLFFVAAPGAASGNNAYVVTVSGAQVANSLTFQTSGGSTLSGGTSITLGNGTSGSGGITMNQFAYGSTAQGAVTISTALILNNSQTWTNNSSNALTFGAGGLSLGANTLTFAGTGNFTAGAGSFGNAGSGGIIMNGTGLLRLSGATNTNYTGSTTINSGVVMINGGSKSTGNFNLNGGMLTDYYQQTAVFSGGLGTGANQIQIHGESGFGGGNGTSTWRIGSALSVLTWGSASFDPTILKFMTSADNLGPSIYGIAALDNGLNLGAAERTIDVLNASANPTTSGGRINGVISNGSLIKTGGGNLTLNNAASTYAGTTTITGGILTANGSGALGDGSATNTLIFNGGTLRAAAAITSAATRGVTLTTNGVIDTNNFAVSFAGNFTGAGGLIKNNTGTLTLSGTNSYSGTTTVNAGTLAITKQSALNDGTSASWTAAKINVKNGAGLQLNVDSAESAGFSAANLNTLLGNILVANTAAQGLQSGAILSIDTSTATGSSFTQGNAITNSSGTFGGMISLSKAGAGSLVFNQANTYTGPTTISAGSLQIDDGGSLSSSLLFLNGGTFASNTSGNLTQGAQIPSLILGTTGLNNVGAGTLVLNSPTFHTGNTTATAGNITLSHASAIRNSALNTTGAGTVTLSNVTTPTLGGLANSGTTRNLADVIDASYASVTELTLKPESGSTFTYGGVISNGASGMTLTKIGAGTQVLQGTNTYSGATTIKNGILSLSGTAGALSNTSGLTLSGGGLTLTSADSLAEDDFDRVNDSAPITSNGGTITYTTTTAASTKVFIETLGSLDLVMGQLNLVNTLDKSAGSQTLALSGLTRSGAANTSAITYSNAGGLNLTNDRIRVNGITVDTAAGQIIGAWATVGTAANAQTDYAMYDSDGTNGFVVARNIAGTAETTWTTAANAYTNSLSAQTLTATRTVTALRNTAATATLTLATGANLETYGLLNGVGTLLTVAPGTGGVLTTPTGGGSLHVNAGSGAITVSAPINNNGGTVTLVKSGSAALTLTSTTSNFSGGVVLNAGTLSIDDVRSIGGTNNTGGSSAPITVNGSSTISMPTNNLTANFGSGAITINNGATFTVSSVSRGTLTFGGAVTGSGGITATSGSFWSRYSFTNTENTFTGPITDSRSGNDGIANALFSFNSIADGAGYGNITLNGANDSGIDYGSGATAALTLNNRQIVLANTNTVFFNNASAQAVNINTDIGFSGTGARQMRFGISGRSGVGINTFAGKLTDNAGGAFTPTFNGGTWVLTNTNSYTGVTTLSAGTLQINTLANGGSNSSIGASSSAAGNLILNGGTLRYTGAAASTDRLFSLQASTTIDASGAGAVNFTNAGSMGFNGGTAAKTLTLTGTNTGNNTIASVIGDLTGATAITKTGIGTWVLSATNTNTGATGLSGGGNLVLDYGTNDTNKIAGVLSLGGGTLTAKGATGSHVEVVTSTSLNAGGTFLTRDGANTAKLRMNAITRAAGGTISFGSATLADTDTNNVNSILGGWATLGNDWAVSANSGAADTAVTALGSYTTWVNSTGSATANYLLNGNGSIVTTGVAANTVKISNSSNSETLALNNLNLTITSTSATSLGGIMYTGGSDGLYSITGGTGRIQTSTANQELIFAVQTGTLSVDAFVGASGSSGPVTKSGNGTLSISSANNYTGATRVNQGVLRLANATAAGTTASAITVQNGAALELANNISVGAKAVTLTGAGVSNGGALRNIASNASSYAGAITLGAGGARINSDANGVLTLTGGVVTSLFNDVTFGGAGNTTVSTAAISGAGGLIKDGAGITTLTATNTYTGATRVSNGILSIGTVASPTGSINSSALTIDGGNFRNNSATSYTGALTFTSGTISGTNWGGSLSNLTIGVDDTVSPGNSPGTAVTGNQTWAGGGTYVWEINSTLGTAGSDPGWDLINGSGTLTITALAELGFNIDVTSLTTGNLAGQVSDFDQSLNYNWLIADFASVTGFSSDKFTVNTGSFANAFTGSFAVALGDSGTIGGDNTQVWLTYTAIPEPKAALLGGLGLLLLLRRRR